MVIITTTLWIFWGMAEMYHEGWGLPFHQTLRYLTLGAAWLVLALVTITWPRLGGWLLVASGTAFTIWWFRLQASRGSLTSGGIIRMFPLSAMVVVTGALFLYESRYRDQLRAQGWKPTGGRLRRYRRYVLAVGIPLITAIATSIYYLPVVLTRVDDGARSARLIEGNGVTLIWAPEGPGWNWKQPWGGYPPWNSIALYGMEPVGIDNTKSGYEERDATKQDMERYCICRYLSEDGTKLMHEQQDIWRMPTTDEIVRSLARHGENAGGSWDGKSRPEYKFRPDKETPLWAPDQEPIYYWSADEYSEEMAYYVCYNGWIRYQPKIWGNPRHGYRCVREP